MRKVLSDAKKVKQYTFQGAEQTEVLVSWCDNYTRVTEWILKIVLTTGKSWKQRWEMKRTRDRLTKTTWTRPAVNVGGELRSSTFDIWELWNHREYQLLTDVFKHCGGGVIRSKWVGTSNWVTERVDVLHTVPHHKTGGMPARECSRLRSLPCLASADSSAGYSKLLSSWPGYA